MTPGQGQGRPPLSRDDVLTAAMDVLRAGGIERLTVRGLAGSLGVAVTAIYWHVGDKQALLDGLADRVVAELGEIRVTGRDPEARVTTLGRSLRRTLLAQPELIGLVHQQGRTAALFQPARRVLARELTAAGLGGTHAARAVEAVLHLVIGSVLVDRQVARQPAQRQTPEELWTAADLPGSPDVLDELAHPVDPEAVFDYSLGVLVRAVLTSAG